LSKELEIDEPSGPEYMVKNRLQQEDEAIHAWYRFILGYPPHLVREYLETLGADPGRDWVLDPFCGTATTPVEARLQGFPTLSIDANPISILATRVKLSWDIDLDQIQPKLEDVLEVAATCLRHSHLTPVAEVNYQLSLFTPPIPTSETKYNGPIANDFDPNILIPSQASVLIPTGFISQKPLLRVLALRYAIEKILSKPDIQDFMALALANTIVTTAGNIGFGPEIYRRPPIEDADVLGAFANTVTRMIEDLRIILAKQQYPFPSAYVFKEDARILSSLTDYPPIGIVITSPPYPNEKDYTRSTRLESVLLGLIKTKKDLRALKSNLLRSNTRNVFASDEDDIFIKDIPSIVNIAQEVEKKTITVG
jgi:hypothetical protein